MMFAVLAFAAALAQTSSAQAQAGGQVDAASQVAAAPAADAAPAAAPEAQRARLVCTTQQVTGTRFPIRRCRTAEQAASDRAESAEMLRRMQGARTMPTQ